MQKIYRIFFLFLIYIEACATNPVEPYLASHPDLAPEIFLAMQNRRVVNGMNKEQVRLVLGEPDFIEHESPETNTLEKWIYRLQQEESRLKSKRPDPLEDDKDDSSFPQGIGHIIPMDYKAKEIRIEFQDTQVFRVQKIIAF